MTKLRFGIVGQYQSGKSLLINCLINRHVATVGVGVATTHTVVNYSFSESELKPENILLSRRSLKKLTIQLIKDGEEIDSLVMDTFVEEGNHAN